MTKDHDISSDSAKLRFKAEKRLKEIQKGQRPEEPGSATETQRLIYELQVHQIELEMQNEELKRSRAELEKGLELYSDLYDFAPVGYFTLDSAGVIRRANLTGARLLGIERGKLAGRHFGPFICDADRPAFSDFLKKVFTGLEKQTFEAALCWEEKSRPSLGRSNKGHLGEDQKTYVHIEAIASEDRQECRAIVTDITERKQAEEALKESEERYRTILQSIEDGYYEVDLAGNLTFFNDSVCRILGNTRNELMGMNNRQYTDKENSQILYQAFNKVFVTGKPSDGVNYEIIIKDGTKLYIQSSVTLIRNKSGEPIGFRGIMRNITEHKKMEEELRESEELFRGSLENAPDGIYMNNLEGNFLYGNRKCEKITGYRREEMIGKNFLELNLLSENSLNKAFQLLQANMEGKSTGPDEIELVSKGGLIIPVEINTNVVHRLGQRIVLASVRDITERKQAEEKLLQTLESLRKSFSTTIQVMVSAVETRDPYTSGHQIRVANIARAIATEMGLPQEKIEGIRMAGSIHDIGKLSIPAEILSKPGRLSEIEFSLIKEHARKGYEMLKDVESLWPLAEIVYQHHERMNGSGYPRNLKGDEILIEARILAVADVLEAMASHRPYRAALGIDAALNEIEKNRGIFYDNTVADACLRLFREKGFKIAGT